MRPALLAAAVAMAAAPAAAQFFQDDFDSGPLDRGVWDACQIDSARAPLRFIGDGGDGWVAVDVHADGLGGRHCAAAAPVSPLAAGVGAVAADFEPQGDDLGPSFADPTPDVRPLAARSRAPKSQNPDCPADLIRRLKQEHTADPSRHEGACIQRQELRPKRRPDAGTAQRYRLRLRVSPEPTAPPATRWVLAQWKEEALTDAALDDLRRDGDERRAPSPFVAVRFDGARLHVTVQDGTCRCLVASAAPTEAFPDAHDWSRFPEGFCRETVGHAAPCATSLALGVAADPALPSPVGRWLDLTLSFRSGPQGRLRIEADGRWIATATGPLGYALRPDGPGKTKFKFGHYRDFRADPPLGSPLEVSHVSVDREP